MPRSRIFDRDDADEVQEDATAGSARESRALLAKPHFIAREVLAWLWYFARPGALAAALAQDAEYWTSSTSYPSGS